MRVVSGFRFSPGGVQQLTGVTPDLTCLAKIVAGGMPGGAVVGRAEIMKLFDMTGDPRRDRHARVLHLGTFNASPPSAAAGITVLRRVATGKPIQQADRMADLLRRSWDDVLERHGVAGYVYGSASIFHVYFETDPRAPWQGIQSARSPDPRCEAPQGHADRAGDPVSAAPAPSRCGYHELHRGPALGAPIPNETSPKPPRRSRRRSSLFSKKGCYWLLGRWQEDGAVLLIQLYWV